MNLSLVRRNLQHLKKVLLLENPISKTVGTICARISMTAAQNGVGPTPYLGARLSRAPDDTSLTSSGPCNPSRPGRNETPESARPGLGILVFPAMGQRASIRPALSTPLSDLFGAQLLLGKRIDMSLVTARCLCCGSSLRDNMFPVNVNRFLLEAAILIEPPE